MKRIYSLQRFFDHYFGLSPCEYSLRRMVDRIPLLSRTISFSDPKEFADFQKSIKDFNSFSTSCRVKLLYVSTVYFDDDVAYFRSVSVFPCVSSFANVLDRLSWSTVLDQIFNYEVKK